MANNIVKYNSRVILKHDTKINWDKATNFIPLKGEIIVYDRDDTYDYERFKIGDGETLVGTLPFTVNPHGHDEYALKANTVTAGKGLTDGGQIGNNPTLNVGQGNGITVTANAVAAKAGNGITVDSTGINHADTSSQASVTASGRKYITGVTLDTYGHVTGLTTGTETVTDTNTTYDLTAPASKTNGNVTIDLTAGGSGSGTDSVKIKGSGTTAVTTDANGVITITSTDNKVTQAAAITTPGEYPILLGYDTKTTSSTNTVNKTSTLKYNPSTKILTAPTFSGDLKGNADTATIAGLAGMANQDGEGRNIITTYATKGMLSSAYYASTSKTSPITNTDYAACLAFAGQGLYGDLYIPYAKEKLPGLLKVAPSENSLEEETSTKRFVKISDSSYYAYVQLPKYNIRWRDAKDSEWVDPSTGARSAKQFWLATTDGSASNQLINESSIILTDGLSAQTLPGGQMYLRGAAGTSSDGKISAYNMTNGWNTWRNCYLKGGESPTANSFLTIGGSSGQSQYLIEARTYYTYASTWETRFKVSTSGVVHATNTTAEGMDYAELFEWEDKNTEAEDRRGLFVVLSIGNKTIQIADNVDNDEILGIVSATPSVVGNAASFHWNKKYLTDVFGQELVQEVEIPEEVLEDGTVIEAHTVLEPILNPDYNPDLEYIPRAMRPEWATVGLLGQLVVCDDGTCVAGVKCKCGTNGMATISTDKTGWRVLERLDENHVRILFK